MEKRLVEFSGEIKKVEIVRGFRATNFIKDIYKHYNGLYIITNERVWSLWGEQVRNLLKDRFFLYVMPDGERYKNIKYVEKIFNFLTGNKATRNSCLVAFGGGVIGDLGGFCASTYHRGMKLIQIPTTLLAMVDSSIGGKTGFNLRSGKNLVGTFYQPDYIITDTEYLSTLSKKEFLSGFAEVIKAGLIADKGLFRIIENNLRGIVELNEKVVNEIISRAQDIKVDVVVRDEKESGLRAILNFGHTLGHSLEKLSNWKIMHGLAVAKGLAFESYISYLKGYLDFGKFKRIIEVVKNFGYRIDFSFPLDKLKESFYYDKKRKDRDVEWVLLKDIGKASFGEVVDDLVLNEALNNYNSFIKDIK